jgi:S-disulfanyl-L-cysteine oxidoreductase SoxD
VRTFWMIALVGVYGAGVAAQRPASQWDGIFTDAQAVRGAPLYAQQCETCHGAELEGEGHAPPLIGDGFATSLNGSPLWELFDKVQSTMPSTSPGSLTPAETADVIAYMFSKAKYPSGARELPTAQDALKAIKFFAAKP